MLSQQRVAIVGSGNWGSCIAKVVGNNVSHSRYFLTEVKMWVFEEIIDGRKLTDIINLEHENIKYLRGIKLPSNVIACPDLVQTVQDADILVIVVPHQFTPKVVQQIKGKVKKGAYAVSLMKGLYEDDQGGIQLFSDLIREGLDIQCAVLMGANLAQEVAEENFCESTIGAKCKEHGAILKSLFQSDYFRLVVTPDEVGVELCGALKNVVALGAGFVDGLGYGQMTKAAVIRLGFMETRKFAFEFFGHRGVLASTFLESCGFADLLTSCYGGRNRKIAIEHARTGIPFAQLERDLLGGQSAQGLLTAREVYITLKKAHKQFQYPLLTAVYQICQGEISVDKFIDCLKNHPLHRKNGHCDWQI